MSMSGHSTGSILINCILHREEKNTTDTESISKHRCREEHGNNSWGHKRELERLAPDCLMPCGPSRGMKDLAAECERTGEEIGRDRKMERVDMNKGTVSTEESDGKHK